MTDTLDLHHKETLFFFLISVFLRVRNYKKE